MRKNNEYNVVYAALIAKYLELITIPFGISLILGLWVFFSWCEASAFNRVTGKNISTWDAMFVTLRVQEGASND